MRHDARIVAFRKLACRSFALRAHYYDLRNAAALFDGASRRFVGGKRVEEYVSGSREEEIAVRNRAAVGRRLRIGVGIGEAKRIEHIRALTASRAWTPLR